ncbi:hypothetical protein PTH_0165 [Pelotomaculum thermopropionicum SI]|uniref:Uncharacterized protein n=1 Tax=Pelotomaculum thermopropionicum (strain DSM 13744 / JCM 10971 / SI) TaxID=370438 RepID=A5D5Y1_PELTS|nr:hypothetical protein PTH_0165 [Pelotomaculum thermopropionicum SI]
MSSNQAATKKRGRPKKNIDLVRVLELERAGKTDQEIAGELGVSVRTFRSFRKKHGIAPAAGWGGARRGAGRKEFSGGSHDESDAYMERQQAIDARVNSIDAGLRAGRFNLTFDQWLKWAGSVFKYSKERGVYTSEEGLGIPAVIRFYIG